MNKQDKVVKYLSYSFEKMRIIQGAMIYSVLVLFMIVGIIAGNIILSLAYFVPVVVLYVVCFIYYYKKLSKSKQRIRSSIVVAALRLLCIPTSMVG
jgi:hypothetical protein